MWVLIFLVYTGYGPPTEEYHPGYPTMEVCQHTGDSMKPIYEAAHFKFEFMCIPQPH
jgi:hypothetical protein